MQEFGEFGACDGVSDMARALEEQFGDDNSENVAFAVEQCAAGVARQDGNGNLPGCGIITVTGEAGDFAFVEFRRDALVFDVRETDREDRSAEFDAGIESQRGGGEFSRFDFEERQVGLAVDGDDFSGEGGIPGAESDVGGVRQHMGGGENESIVGNHGAGSIPEEFGFGRGLRIGVCGSGVGFLEFEGGMVVAGVKDDGGVVGLNEASAVETTDKVIDFAIKIAGPSASGEMEESGGIGSGVGPPLADVSAGECDLGFGVAGAGGFDEIVVTGERVPERCL